MIKSKTLFFKFIITALLLITSSLAQAADYSKTLSPQERQNICDSLQAAQTKKSGSDESLDNPIVPNGALLGVYNATRNISQSIAMVSVLGDTLMCHAVHGQDKKSVKIPKTNISLFSYPNVPMWLCGAIIYCFGFMMVLSITFYVVDIAFKLGLAVLLLPIGVALWPFSAKIKDLDVLAKLIAIILKSAAIFVFLALTTSFALNLIGVAVGGLEEVFDVITENADSDVVSEHFTLTSSAFLIVVVALIYGFKLIGAAVSDYASKFFPDKAFGQAAPIHGMMTQSIDFATKKVVKPAASLVHDIATTQAGRGVVQVGKFIRGDFKRRPAPATSTQPRPQTPVPSAGGPIPSPTPTGQTPTPAFSQAAQPLQDTEQQETPKPLSPTRKTVNAVRRVIGNMFIRTGEQMQDHRPRQENAKDAEERRLKEKEYDDNRKSFLGGE
ncbi:MAG: hypothetical protein IJS26_02795 [Alphaproteobacteria bacterium]|nr:hypothetical protein [Alphaproteobacteria bacterium]